MKKLKYWGAVLLISAAFWWVATELKDRNDPLNKSDSFVYSSDGILYWFELTLRFGKVYGTLHQQNIIEKVGKVPYMEEKKYPLTGKTTKKGYEFDIKNGEKVMKFDAWLSRGNLLVQKQGEKDYKLYKAVSQEGLNEYAKAIQQKLQTAIDQSEEKEKNRLNKFFSELNRVYGYLYSAKGGSFQLFLKIDEALRQGELTGSLLMVTENPYKETKYNLNGITDGMMVEFFTTVDGKETKLKGSFYKDATGFDLSFWTTGEKLPFHAITEEEFKQRYEGF